MWAITDPGCVQNQSSNYERMGLYYGSCPTWDSGVDRLWPGEGAPLGVELVRLVGVFFPPRHQSLPGLAVVPRFTRGHDPRHLLPQFLHGGCRRVGVPGRACLEEREGGTLPGGGGCGEQGHLPFQDFQARPAWTLGPLRDVEYFLARAREKQNGVTQCYTVTH